MVRRLGDLFTRLSHRFIPHPFVFAILLTLLAFLLALVWSRATPRQVVTAWFDGMTGPGGLAFALQMALILLTGHALAETHAVRAGLRRIAGAARGTRSAVVLVSLTAMGAALLNWGLGLIVGATLARAVARDARARGVRVHYPLVVAAGYTGLLVWHGGFSGSAPLSVASPEHPLERLTGVLPITTTLLSPLNLFVTLFFVVAVPLLLAGMAPREESLEEAPAHPEEVADADDAAPLTPARRLEQSRLLVALVSAAGLLYLVLHFAETGWRGVQLNPVILLFLLAGMLLHGTAGRYVASIDEAVKGAGGILLQFPFYFGIMGVMSGTGLTERLANLSIGTAESLGASGIPVGSAHAVLTFVSAAVVNLFVPSGGGQWAVQGPIAVEASVRLGTSLSDTVLAVAYGDELTNMLQPFWALPLLAITRLHARRIVGYTSLLMLLVAPGPALLLALFGAW